MWAAQSAGVAYVPKRTAAHLAVSISGYLLTDGSWKIGSMSIWGYLLSEGMWILAAGGLEMIKMSYICIYADIFDTNSGYGRQCDRPVSFELKIQQILSGPGRNEWG